MGLAPGWYQDPADPTTQRWWDGEGWLGEPLPADQPPPPGPPSTESPINPPDPQLPAVPGLPGAAETPPPPEQSAQRTPERSKPDRSAGGGTGRSGFRMSRSAPDSTGQLSATGQLSLSYRPGQGPPRPHGYPLATLGSRVLARLVDIAAVLALNVVVNGWFVYQYWQEISPVLAEAWRRSLAGESMGDLPAVGDEAGYLQLIILILAAALWFAYEVPAVANTGQTPGKRLLRIKVVPVEQQPEISFGRSFRRWNTMGLPTLLWWCFGIGFLLQLVDALFALFDRPLHQALHDKSAQTAVVSVATAPSKEAIDEPADPS